MTVEQEFGSGREKPRFLEEQLEQSAREMAEKKQWAVERHKQRLADQMEEKLGGKRGDR